MRWLENLSAAVAYIEDHLDQEISVDAAARIACCSAHVYLRGGHHVGRVYPPPQDDAGRV